MAFLITIIVGLLVAWINRNKGFIAMWILLFNTLSSIYLSIMLSPTLFGHIKVLNSSGYYRALSILFTAILVFLSLHSLVNILLAPVFGPELPRLFESFGTFVVGFLAGHFACGFFIFVIGLMPLAQAGCIKKYMDGKNLAQSVSIPVTGSCQILGALSFQTDRRKQEEIINWLAATGEPKQKRRSSLRPSGNSPAENPPPPSSGSDCAPDSEPQI